MDHERVDENTFVCFLQSQTYDIQKAKNIFWTVCQEMGLLCIEKDVLFMVGEKKVPFETFITLTLIPHPTKGYLGVLQSKPINKLQSFGASLIPSWLACHNTLHQCREWYHCNKHWLEGLEKLHQNFFEKYLHHARDQNVSNVPEDTNPVCLDATCLPVNSTHISSVAFNEKRVYYSDIASHWMDKQIVVQVESPKRIQLLVRYNDKPNALHRDVFTVSTKQQNSFLAEFVLNGQSTPELIPGRWFFALRGSSLLSKSKVKISLTAISYAAPQEVSQIDNRLSVSYLMPEAQEDDEWIFVADDSSAQGRKLKPQLVGSFEPKGPVECSPVSVEQKKAFSYNPHAFGDQDVPDSFLCPITRDIMNEPVVAADGFSYELKAIETWLEDHIRSPMTGDEMKHKMLIPNFNLRSQIDQWKEQHQL